ncbi:MAG: 4-phosphoerythronate dehydrogenase [Bacteroidota bacterium]
MLKSPGLHLVVDANIPFAEAAFGRYGTVQMLPGRAITRETLSETDVLLVRSVTRVDPALVEGTPVRFVASATAGTDHVDAEGLAAQGIDFAHAPGSNAASVVDWVLASLLHIAVPKGEGLEGKTLGVVGVGEVGGRLLPRAEALGMRVLQNDPPRQAAGHTGPWTPLSDLLAEADVVTIHTPLTREGPHATHHLIGEAELAAMREGVWLLNAARGPVVDGTALLRGIASRHLGAVALDVWENEPTPTPALASRVDLGTPHIAGYAFDGKVRGTVMVEAALRNWMQDNGIERPDAWNPESALAPSKPLVVEVPHPTEVDPATPTDWLHYLVCQAYDIAFDDRLFRLGVAMMPDEGRRADAFTELRRTYPVRREWSRYRVEGLIPAELETAVREGLGMTTSPASAPRRREP